MIGVWEAIAAISSVTAVIVIPIVVSVWRLAQSVDRISHRMGEVVQPQLHEHGERIDALERAQTRIETDQALLRERMRIERAEGGSGA